MFLKIVLPLFIITLLLCIQKIRATSKFSKETVQGFLDDPHLGQVLMDFVAAGYDSIKDKEEREIKMLEIMFKNDEYVVNTMEMGFTHKLVEYIKSDNYNLQLEAIKSIGKAVGQDSKYGEELIDAGVIPELIEQLHSTDSEIIVESLQTIVKFILYPEFRGQFLEYGLEENIVEFVVAKTSTEILSATGQLLMSLAMVKKYPISTKTVKRIIPAFKDLIQHSDLRIARFMTWTLLCLTDTGNSQYEINLNKKFVDILFQIYHGKDPMLKEASIGILNNIVTGRNEQTQMILDNGILKLLPELLMHQSDPEFLVGESEKLIVKHTILLISKLFKENSKSVFDSGIMPLILYHLARGVPEFNQKAAAITATTAAAFSNEKQITKMLDFNLIPSLCNMLIKVEEENNSDMITVIFLGITKVLEKCNPKKINEIVENLEECGGIKIISKFNKNGNNEDISLTERIAHAIIESYHLTKQTFTPNGKVEL